MKNIRFGLSNGVYAEMFSNGKVYVANIPVNKGGQTTYVDITHEMFDENGELKDNVNIGWRPATDQETNEFMQKMQKLGGRKKSGGAGQKITMEQFSEWLGLEPDDVRTAIAIVKISDPDSAYSNLEDMGEEGAAEAVSTIYFDYGSLSAAIKACKEDLGMINESNKKLEKFVRSIIK